MKHAMLLIKMAVAYVVLLAISGFLFGATPSRVRGYAGGNTVGLRLLRNTLNWDQSTAEAFDPSNPPLLTAAAFVIVSGVLVIMTYGGKPKASASDWFKGGWRDSNPAGASDFHPHHIPRYPLAQWVIHASQTPLSPACADILVTEIDKVTPALFDRLKLDHQIDEKDGVELFERYLGVVCPECLNGYNGAQLMQMATPTALASLGASVTISTTGLWRRRLLEGRCPNCDSRRLYVLWRGITKR